MKEKTFVFSNKLLVCSSIQIMKQALKNTL